ncbi:MAG: hypothetical protein AAB421_00430 [Patescibacteria group bacterium]
MTRILVLAVLALLFATPAMAADTVTLTCERVLGWFSWMGFLKTLGVTALTVGIGGLFWHWLVPIVTALWKVLEKVIDIAALLASAALIASGHITPDAYKLWPVLGGSIAFGASTLLFIVLRNIKGTNPAGLYAFLALVWGGVAVFYGMSEVGFLTMAAVMGVLGYTVVVSPFCYGFGFKDDDQIATGSSAALLILSAYTVQHIFFPGAPAWVKVFAPGAFWLGSLVSFTGILIMSNVWYGRGAERSNYGLMQAVALVIYLGGVFAGMTFGINPLAGMAGFFFVFWVAAKFIEIPTEKWTGFYLKLTLMGAFLSGVWWIGHQNEAHIIKYLTTTLPI